MPLRIYSTLTRTREEFHPVVPGQVSMYLCGPTVYKPAHIGHMVGPVIFDTIKRYLSYLGYKVTWVVNITDVDDKLIVKASELGTTVDALAKKMTKDYLDNLATLGVTGIDHMPYATQYISEMQEIISGLIAKGYAYPLNGDVYFECGRDEDYGKLSGRNLNDMLAGTRAETMDGKHNPADFALWKSSKPGEPAWDSPWGPGRPGWHIECSAMSRKLLGDTIDIHGGGLDLMFPHHENELAQSESFTGKCFCNFWMHNGLLRKGSAGGKIGGDHSRHGDLMAEKVAQEEQKLAGSKGAESVRTAVFAKFPPETVRFFLVSTHYRSPVDFGDDRLEETARSLDGFYRQIETFQRITGQDFYSLEASSTRTGTASLEGTPTEFFSELRSLRDRFYDCMDDDFNTGGGVGVLFDLRKTINGFIASAKLEGEGRGDGAGLAALTAGMTLLKELSSILGVFLKLVAKPASGNAADDEFVDGLMKLLIELRAALRKEKNFALADRIRNELTALKVTLEDRPDGTGWKRG